MTDPWVSGQLAALGLARAFNPREARVTGGKGGGRWTHVGAAMQKFAYDGAPGGEGHARAMEEMARVLDGEKTGRETAATLRMGIRSMMTRDLPAAGRHLDGAIYQDQVNNGGMHRPELEQIKASLGKVPKAAAAHTRMPAVPAALGKKLRGAGMRPAPGVVGGYASGGPAQYSGYESRARWVNRELHRYGLLQRFDPRELRGPHGEWAKGAVPRTLEEQLRPQYERKTAAAAKTLAQPRNYEEMLTHLRDVHKLPASALEPLNGGYGQAADVHDLAHVQGAAAQLGRLGGGRPPGVPHTHTGPTADQGSGVDLGLGQPRTGVARTAQTATASTVPEPIGNPAGAGLWKHKGWQLPPYIQHLATELMKHGKDESKAISMAVGIVRGWAAGRTGKGGHVHPDVQAAAVKNITQWEALKARTKHGAK